MGNALLEDKFCTGLYAFICVESLRSLEIISQTNLSTAPKGVFRFAVGA